MMAVKNLDLRSKMINDFRKSHDAELSLLLADTFEIIASSQTRLSSEMLAALNDPFDLYIKSEKGDFNANPNNN